MDITASTPTTTDTQLPELPGYPRTTDGWVTFQRVPHPLGTALVQKRDGCTRTVMLPRR
jgi:hypothetical protein